MSNREYGLEFTYKNKPNDKKIYPSRYARNRAFKTWKANLSDPDYDSGNLKSVSKFDREA